jgi:hypothetical protein
MYIYLHVKDLLFLLYLNKTRIYSIDFRKIPKHQIPWKSVQSEPSCSMWMDRQRDMTKLMDTFCNFVNISDNMYYQRLFRFSPDLPEHKYTEDELPHQIADLYCMIWRHKLQHLHHQRNFRSSYMWLYSGFSSCGDCHRRNWTHYTLLVASLNNWPHWTDRNPYTSTIDIAWAASEVTTTFWWWQWLAETCWSKSGMHQWILLLLWCICWLLYNDITKMLGPTIKS